MRTALETIKVKKAEYTKETTENQFVNWKKRPMHSQYLKNTEEKTSKTLTWSWLRSDVKETEGYTGRCWD